jgi:hypothetical protein
MNNTECQPVVIALDHVQLAMPKGEERSAEEFYCELLGFQKVSKPSHLEQRGGCWSTANGVNLHLGVDLQFVPARKAHPGFVVKSLSALKRHFASLVKGVTKGLHPIPTASYLRKSASICGLSVLPLAGSPGLTSM